MLLTFLPATRSVLIEFALRFVVTTAGTSAATVSTVTFPAAVSASSTAIPSVSEAIASTTASTRTTSTFSSLAFRLRRFHGDTSSVYLEAVHRVHDTVGFSLFYLEE